MLVIKTVKIGVGTLKFLKWELLLCPTNADTKTGVVNLEQEVKGSSWN